MDRLNFQFALLQPVIQNSAVKNNDLEVNFQKDMDSAISLIGIGRAFILSNAAAYSCNKKTLVFIKRIFGCKPSKVSVNSYPKLNVVDWFLWKK